MQFNDWENYFANVMLLFIFLFVSKMQIIGLKLQVIYLFNF